MIGDGGLSEFGQSSFFNFYYCRWFGVRSEGFVVNPLSLISTIVDFGGNANNGVSQSSFFNFYYCRSVIVQQATAQSILFL